MPTRLTQVFNRICFMVTIPLVSIIHVVLNTYRPNMHNLKTAIDDIIPFTPMFVVPYIYWFLYITMVLFYFAVVDYKYYFRLLMSIIAGMFVCFIIFYFYPTTVPRPEVFGEDIFSRLVRDFIYKKDNPYNCFPSIHVLNSLLVTLFFCKFNKSTILRTLAVLSCVSITLSTLFIKQHYVADMVASLLLGTSVYVLFTTDSLWNSVPVKRIMDFLIPARVRNLYMD
ncbi:MAG: phosphatase PAP2 family protein [Clostridia bacterium]|nr:phosphatase PAP2 family protein [Clostridia bacterium]